MFYLIDGYNLLYAMGVLLPGREGPKVLERARRYLLGVLRDAHGDESGNVTVVFDAKHPPPGAPAEQDFEGIRVAFAVSHDEADDLIELLVRRAPAPRQLSVVSDDHRVRQAARRRQCQELGCGEYMDWLASRRRPPAAPPAAEGSTKPEGPSGEETQRWLREFGGLENDPDLKELFDPPMREGEPENDW
jgi:hypothetical protein